MTAGSIEDVAHRAGVSVDYVAELVRLGILVPETNGAFNDGHARRAAVVKGMSVRSRQHRNSSNGSGAQVVAGSQT